MIQPPATGADREVGVLEVAEPEHGGQGRKASERIGCHAEHRIGPSEIELEHRGGEPEAHECHQALLEQALAMRERVACVREVADLEEGEQPEEDDRQTVGDANCEVLAIASQQPRRKCEACGGHPVADEQPIQDRPAADVRAHDGRVPNDAPEDHDAQSSNGVTEHRNTLQRGDVGRTQGRQRERDGEVAAVERNDECERECRDGRGGKGACSEVVCHGRRIAFKDHQAWDGLCVQVPADIAEFAVRPLPRTRCKAGSRYNSITTDSRAAMALMTLVDERHQCGDCQGKIGLALAIVARNSAKLNSPRIRISTIAPSTAVGRLQQRR